MKILVTPHDTENKLYVSEIDDTTGTIHLGKGAELFDSMEGVKLKYAKTHEIIDTSVIDA